jgi:hypothetical protein
MINYPSVSDPALESVTSVTTSGRLSFIITCYAAVMGDSSLHATEGRVYQSISPTASLVAFPIYTVV